MIVLAIIAAVGLLAFGILLGTMCPIGGASGEERPIFIAPTDAEMHPSTNPNRERVPAVPCLLVDLGQYRKSVAQRSHRLLDRVV